MIKYEVGWFDTHNMLAVVVAYVADLRAAINMAKLYKTGYVYKPHAWLEQRPRSPFPVGWMGTTVYETNGNIHKEIA